MGKCDGHQWGELLRFQNEGLPVSDGLEGATRAQQYFHQTRGLDWGGSAPPEQLLAEMRRSLAYFLGHLLVTAKYLEADVLGEYVAWSEELGVTLPERPFAALPGVPPYPAAPNGEAR